MSESERIIPKTEWKWFGHAGHLIVGQWCRFHLCTLIGEYLISTVGEYWPERAVREIHAKIHDAKWFLNNCDLKGDSFDAAYMKRFGFETIGCDRTFETMVFKVVTGKYCSDPKCGCGLPEIERSELDFEGYSNAGSAAKGHMQLCEKWSAPLIALAEREKEIHGAD